MRKTGVMTIAMCSAILSVNVFAADCNFTVVDSEEGTVVLAKVYTEENDDGELSIALEMTATAKGPEATSPYELYSIDPYQKGKALDYTTPQIDTELYDKANNNLFTSIKDGASEDFGNMFLLADDSDVELVFYHYPDTDNATTVYYSIKNDKISTDAPIAEDEPDYKAMYEELKAEYDELLKEYNELKK